MRSAILRHRPSLLVGLAVAVVAGAVACIWLQATTAVLVGWDAGVIGYSAMFVGLIRRSTPGQLAAVCADMTRGGGGC